VEGDGVRIGIADCPALHEGDAFTWLSGLGGPMDAALNAVVAAFDPQARCERVTPAPGEAHAYLATIDRTRPEQPDVPELGIAKISTGARFRFRRPVTTVVTRSG
jgi:hypothetical protein